MMTKHPRYLSQAAVLAALYTVLTHFQNILLPGSASWAVQLRLSEALCVLAFFTPAAAPGLGVGCLLFNLTSGAALPLDFLLGTAATVLACRAMWRLKAVTWRGWPLPGLLLPALTNGLLVGGQLAIYIGGSFWLQCLYVALGETLVLLIPGSVLYWAVKRRRLGRFFA